MGTHSALRYLATARAPHAIPYPHTNLPIKAHKEWVRIPNWLTLNPIETHNSIPLTLTIIVSSV